MVEKKPGFCGHLLACNVIKHKKMWITDFFSLIYPRICACCGNSLVAGEVVICRFCEYHLPKTNDFDQWNNPVSKLFWGRASVRGAAAYLLFNKGNRVQQLIHELKYRGRKDIGIYLGSCFGTFLKNSPVFQNADVIFPVPLHRKKYMKRGYNQSEQFAIGLSASMKIPVNTKCLVRRKPNETQTRKSRFARWRNVENIFSVNQGDRFRKRHILLVDDVITTGSTLESCIQTLYHIPDVTVSVAAIAYARH